MKPCNKLCREITNGIRQFGMNMINILIIDDDLNMSRMMIEMIREAGYQGMHCGNLADGLRALRSDRYEVVFLDLRLPDGNGLDILPQIRRIPSAPEVIILTGFGDRESAETAIKHGVWDYLPKKGSPKRLILQIQRIVEYQHEIANRNDARPVALSLEGIVGQGPLMRTGYNLIAQAAVNDVNVYLTGETGTGKELFARAIHHNSSRRDQHFVVVDCASLPETLVESILFGHAKGAFTGADKPREGLIALAHGGTLFLDEIGELPLKVQKVFLRVLQERTYRPVGSQTEHHSDFRLISATNRNLDQAVKASQFRHDLLFRLQGLTITPPALRNRADDIAELTLYFINKLCRSFNVDTKGFSPEFIDVLIAYQWPGNVREFIRALEHAITTAQTDKILYPVHLPQIIRTAVIQHAIAPLYQDNHRETTTFGPMPKLKDLLEQIEREYLTRLLVAEQRDIKQLINISGLSQSRLYDRLKKYGIRSTEKNRFSLTNPIYPN